LRTRVVLPLSISYHEVENLLETYDLEEILELNELTEADVLFFLLEKNFVFLPEPLPVDLI